MRLSNCCKRVRRQAELEYCFSAYIKPKPLIVSSPGKCDSRISPLTSSFSTVSNKAEMAWGLWTCPVDCSLRSSSEVAKIAPYGDISGPGVGNLSRAFFQMNTLTLLH